jgi:hypothetical protein
VHAHEDVLAVADLPHHHRDVRGFVDVRAVRDPAKFAELRRQIELRDPVDEFFMPHAVRDQIFDRDELQAVLRRILAQAR